MKEKGEQERIQHLYQIGNKMEVEETPFRGPWSLPSNSTSSSYLHSHSLH